MPIRVFSSLARSLSSFLVQRAAVLAIKKKLLSSVSLLSRAVCVLERILSSPSIFCLTSFVCSACAHARVRLFQEKSRANKQASEDLFLCPLDGDQRCSHFLREWNRTLAHFDPLDSPWLLLSCIAKAYHVQTHWTRALSCACGEVTTRWAKAIVAGVAFSLLWRVLMISSEGELSSGTSRALLFMVIEINGREGMMIDSRYRRQNTLMHETSHPMIIASRLCVHCAQVSSGVCVVNSIDYAYSTVWFISIFFFAHHLTLDSDQSSFPNRSLPDHYREWWRVCLCRHAAGRCQRGKKVSVNIIRWERESLLRVCGEDGLCVFSQSVIANVNCWNTQMSIRVCACVNTGQISQMSLMWQIWFGLIETNTSFLSLVVSHERERIDRWEYPIRRKRKKTRIYGIFLSKMC